MDNADILERLIETERSSRELVESAQAEIDQRMSETKRAAEEKRRRAREEAVKTLEETLKSSKAAVHGEYEGLLAAYQASLDSRVPDVDAFSAALRTILSAES